MSDTREAAFAMFIEQLTDDITSARVSLAELAEILRDGNATAADTLFLIADVLGSSAWRAGAAVDFAYGTPFRPNVPTNLLHTEEATKQ